MLHVLYIKIWYRATGFARSCVHKDSDSQTENAQTFNQQAFGIAVCQKQLNTKLNKPSQAAYNNWQSLPLSKLKR